MATVLVNGKVKELSICDRRGLDWTLDFVGGFSGVQIAEDLEVDGEAIDYIMNEDLYEYFVNIAALTEECEELEMLYKERFGDLPDEYPNLSHYDYEDGIRLQVEFLKAKMTT